MLAGVHGNCVTVDVDCIKVFCSDKVLPITKKALWPGLDGLTCTTTPPTPVGHQHIRAETDSGGKTGPHLTSVSSVTPLLPAAFMPPDTKFKVISS